MSAIIKKQLKAFRRASISDARQIIFLMRNSKVVDPDMVINMLDEEEGRRVEKDRLRSLASKNVEQEEDNKSRMPPCDGCEVAKWVKFSCGVYGWECQSLQKGKCNAI